MHNPDLLAFLREEEARSRNDELVAAAADALRSYNGEEYGDEVAGRSRVVTRDVAEVIDHMEVSVLRTFVSGDRVVEFEPTSPDQVQMADDATEVISRDLTRNGYQLLHDWFKEGNLSTLGIIKTCVERKKVREEFTSIDPQGDGAIEADEIEGSAETLGVPLYKAVRLADAPPQFKDYLVPLEEFRVSPDARCLDDAVYVAHATEKTLSQLVEMGFSTEDVDLAFETSLADPLSSARDSGRTQFGEDRTGANRTVLLLEEYVRFDADGDGIAELLCVHRVGNTILQVDSCDYQPFVAYCPFPMPARLWGHSLADKVVDIQRINTVLNRLALDGLYCNLAPGYLVPDECVNENTYDDLLTVRPNRLVRYKGIVPPVSEGKNDVSAVAWQAMEFMIGQRESRTGITRLNQGLDADTLNKTATGTALMQAQGQQIEEYLARNFGEAVSRWMRLKLKQRARYGQPMQLRVDGEFRDIDPSQWPEEMDVIIRVGLGSGKKEQRLNNRMLLLQVQRECMMNGLPIVGPEHIYKSVAGVVRDAGLGSPADFVADPATLPPQEPQPSPEEQKLAAETQLQAAKIQGDQQMQAQKIEAMREEAALKADLARDQAQADLELAAQKAQFEAQLAREKFEFEKQLAAEKLAFEERRAVREAERRDYETESKVSSNRPGGKLDA